jgi:hypothetical protein
MTATAAIADDNQREQVIKRQLSAQQRATTLPVVAPIEREGARSVEDEATSRRPGAIMGRLRSERQKELSVKRASASKTLVGSEAVGRLEDIQKAVKRLKNIYRIINGASACTLLGIILTVIVMNLQLILGNLFKVKLVPSLDLWEVILIGVLDLIILAALLIILVPIVCAALIWEQIKVLTNSAFEVIRGLL